MMVVKLKTDNKNMKQKYCISLYSSRGKSMKWWSPFNQIARCPPKRWLFLTIMDTFGNQKIYQQFFMNMIYLYFNI